MERCILSYNGERRDPVSGASHLGKGYRAYTPQLLRFASPDSLSPFGAGGLNAYAYCAGDPINRADPSGHFSWQAGLGIGLGVLGLLSAAFTGGMSLVAEGGLMAALNSVSTMSLIAGSAGIVADSTGIVSIAISATHPSAASVLGWVAFATGIISGISVLGPLMKANRQMLSDTVITTFGRSERDFRHLSQSGVIADFNGQQMEEINFTFVDLYKKEQTRLNIHGHGFIPAGRSSALMQSGKESVFTPEALAKYLRENKRVNFRDYDTARLIMCHSAEGMEDSFAARFARETRLPTKGFIGTVQVETPVQGFVNLTDRGNMGGADPWTDIELNENINAYRNNVSLFTMVKQNHRSWRNYQSVIFDANGNMIPRA